MGDLGVSSPTGMSRANSRDSGHIPTQAPTQYATGPGSGPGQGRMSRDSAEQHHQPAARQSGLAQRGSPHQGSPYSSLEAMLSSIPESLSIPSMPSMPSVPSMSDIERSMQSGWSSFTGSLGLSPAPQQEAATPAGWAAFADDGPLASASHAVPAVPPAATAAVRPSTSELPYANVSSSAVSGPEPQQGRLSLAGTSQAGQSLPGNQTPFTSSRRKPTGLQSIDPLAAAKEAASVPLRAMSSMKQMPSPRGGSQQPGMAATPPQGGGDRIAAASAGLVDASVPVMDASPSNDWSDFATAHPLDNGDAQSPARHAQPQGGVQMQDPSNAVGTDLWAQWSIPVAQDAVNSQHASKRETEERVAPLAGQLSLLDL